MEEAEKLELYTMFICTIRLLMRGFTPVCFWESLLV